MQGVGEKLPITISEDAERIGEMAWPSTPTENTRKKITKVLDSPGSLCVRLSRAVASEFHHRGRKGEQGQFGFRIKRTRRNRGIPCPKRIPRRDNGCDNGRDNGWSDPNGTSRTKKQDPRTSKTFSTSKTSGSHRCNDLSLAHAGVVVPRAGFRERYMQDPLAARLFSFRDFVELGVAHGDSWRRAAPWGGRIRPPVVRFVRMA